MDLPRPGVQARPTGSPSGWGPAGQMAPGVCAATRSPRAIAATERKVLTLLGRGRSNPEMAATLYALETTLRTHVQRILAKLGLRDRIQAVILAGQSQPAPPQLHQE